MKTKEKKQNKLKFKSKQLKCCKHCKGKLYDSDVSIGEKKYLEEKPGFWGGVEKPYELYHHINCSNHSCKKHYTVKIQKSDWLYK